MPRDYQPIGDTWQRYAVPLRTDDEDGRAMGREYTELRADELTDAEIATLSADERADAVPFRVASPAATTKRDAGSL